MAPVKALMQDWVINLSVNWFFVQLQQCMTMQYACLLAVCSGSDLRLVQLLAADSENYCKLWPDPFEEGTEAH